MTSSETKILKIIPNALQNVTNTKKSLQNCSRRAYTSEFHQYKNKIINIVFFSKICIFGDFLKNLYEKCAHHFSKVF